MNLSKPEDGRTASESNSSVTPDLPRDMVSRFRKGAPKSRTGCRTCKIRRIKCDEQKPSCRRCVSTGRKCDGYNPPKKTIPETFRRLEKSVAVPVPVKQVFSASVTTYIPSIDIQASMNERRSFHYFRSRNLSDMTGNFEPYFWDTLLLQFSHAYPTVQKSLIALSAIYERHENDGRLLANTALTSDYVLQQYTKAIKGLVDYLSSENQDPRVALVSCLMFVWIEFLQKNLDSGFQHLNSGIKILQHVRKSNPLMMSSNDGQCDKEDIYGSLNRSFTRLRIQAAIHGSESIGIATSLTREMETMELMPRSFSNIFESRICLDNEFNAIFGYIRGLRDHGGYPSFGDMDEPAIAATQRAHLPRLEQWKGATEALMAGSVEHQDTFLTSSFLYLRMYYTLLTVLLTTLIGNEMCFDEYTPAFEQILTFSEKLLHDHHHEKPPPLSFDMGIIPPLFFVLLKCRLLRLRLKALELLRLAPEQEGMWFRDSILKICEWKITMEGAGRGDLPLDALLPESARIYQEHIGDENQTIGPTVMCLKYRRGPPRPGDLESVELPADMELIRAMGNML